MAGTDPVSQQPQASPLTGHVSGVFAVDARQEGPAVVLTVSGDVDMTSGQALRDKIHLHLKDKPPVLVVDLSSVTFFGTAGIGALVEGRNAALPDTTLRLVTDNRIVLRPIQITGIDQLFTVFTTPEQALAAD